MSNKHWPEHYKKCIADSRGLEGELSGILEKLEKVAVPPGSTGGLSNVELGCQPSRARSIARTKLEEAIMWLQADVRELEAHPFTYENLKERCEF